MENKLRIVHLIQSLSNGGCENMLLRTLPFITRFNHTVITLESEGDLASAFRKNGIRVVNVGSITNLLPTINSLRPNLIITYLFHADFWGRILLRTFTKVQVIPFLRTTYNYPRYIPMRIFERLSSFLVVNYLANSESVKNYYVSNLGVASKKITVIPNGINTNKFNISKSKPKNFRKQLHMPDSDTIFVCVANLLPNKGHKYLLQAFEEVHNALPGTWLILVGDGIMRTDLKNMIKSYRSRTNILFLGQRHDVDEILSSSDIFVLPTLFEGMSNAIMEAMACGLPVITTNIPENRELITHGYTGYLIKPRDVLGLKNQMQDLVEDKFSADKTGMRGKQIINRKYNIRLISNKLTSYFLSKTA